MNIQAFAILKEFFNKEFELVATPSSIEALKVELCKINPSAKSVLNICRFAVNNEFIDDQFKLNEHDTVCIIPPSSGG
jgi:sulfur-carrier protein